MHPFQKLNPVFHLQNICSSLQHKRKSKRTSKWNSFHNNFQLSIFNLPQNLFSSRQIHKILQNLSFCLSQNRKIFSQLSNRAQKQFTMNLLSSRTLLPSFIHSKYHQASRSALPKPPPKYVCSLNGLVNYFHNC